MKNFATLVFGILLSTLITAPTHAQPNFTELESLGAMGYCGITKDAQTACVSVNPLYSIFVPDLVGNMQSIYANDIGSCGMDEEGVKCWAVGPDSMVGGKPTHTLLRALIQNSKPNLIQFSQSIACGVEKPAPSAPRGSGDTIRCIATFWDASNGGPLVTLKTKAPVTALSASENRVCWSESGTTDITCKSTFYSSDLEGVKLRDAIELRTTDSWLCARSQTEAKCWMSGERVVDMDPAVLHAKQWVLHPALLCILAQDGRVRCFDPEDGTEMSGSASYLVPKEFQVPSQNILTLWNSDDMACVHLKKDGSVQCWDWQTGTASPLPFPERVRELSGGSYPCAILESGSVECRLTWMPLSRTFPKGKRVRVELSSYYHPWYWSESAIDLRGSMQTLAYQEIKKVSSSTLGDVTCVVGIPTGSASKLAGAYCHNASNNSVSSPPRALMNVFDIATSQGAHCALSDEGLTCWGTKLTGQPNSLSGPQKIRMAGGIACATDRFGFVCWGDLTKHALQVPIAYTDQPGRVVDFAVSESAICVALDDGKVDCWGSATLNTKVPSLDGVISLISHQNRFCALKSGATPSNANEVICWGELL